MKKLLLVSVGAFALSTSANAATVFAGSWDVYNAAAPQWTEAPPNGPLAYTGQEAAALLFGGNASDYVISTIDSDIANINNMAWYDVIGFGGSVFAEDYSNKYLGQFYGPTSGFVLGDNTNAASAFIRDNLSNAGAINFAFRVDGAVPEPATWAFMIFGFGAIGGAMRRQRKANVKVSYA